jgi:ATP-dependent DNA ligase
VISDPATTRNLRPQEFGRRNPRHIDDPLIEPLWIGLRVLAHVSNGQAELVDNQGDKVDAGATVEAVAAAVASGSAVVDGYLTVQALQGSEGVYTGDSIPTMTPGEVARQMFLGGGRNRRKELAESLESPVSMPDEAEIDAAFVAVDLLVIDGESLLDVPLLERKRLLESIIREGPLARLGIHVKPPIGSWLSTWRAAGFRSLGWKGANSRYRPGQPNDDWAVGPIPRR